MCTLEKSQLYIDYTTLSSGIAFSKVAPNSLSSPNSTRAIHKEASDVGFYEGGFNLVGTGKCLLFVHLLFRCDSAHNYWKLEGERDFKIEH